MPINIAQTYFHGYIITLGEKVTHFMVMSFLVFMYMLHNIKHCLSVLHMLQNCMNRFLTCYYFQEMVENKGRKGMNQHIH